MRNWKSIHGYKVARNRMIPKDRQNFIFLDNPLDVGPAVHKQFMNYKTNPSRYGLPTNPTVAQALGVFDQTGVKGKLSFLRSNGINPDAPLAALFQEA